MGDKAKKQVKVDNWGMFFLQRLQQHFAKSEFCDFTLHFSNDQEVKAHRLVLDVCTEYFQMLEKQGHVEGNVISMPADMHPDVVIPVVNFMYTGRLEFHADIQERLYSTAQKMKMTVLTKLLDAQSLNNQQQKLAQAQQLARPQARAVAAQRATPTKRAFPPGTFTNLQGKRVSPRQADPNLPQMLPGRKLPIWTRRSIPQQANSGTSYANFDRPIRIIAPVVDETPRPTRFEWPDDDEENSPSPLATTFEDISYESKPLMQVKETTKLPPSKARLQPVKLQKRATFEDVFRAGAVTKRSATSQLPVDEAKRIKTMNLQDVKDYVQEAQVRKNMLKTDSDEEDVDNDLAMIDTNDDEDDEDETAAHNVVPHKSILKTQSSHEEDASNTTKKVRFSLEPASADEKENETAKVEQKPLPTRAVANQSAGSAPPVTNHAKIITEVLKKYPHLVKNNKNIRLKIMQRGGAPQAAVEKDAAGRQVKSRVSYVVLKSDVGGTKGKSLGIKHGGQVEQFSTLDAQQKSTTGAENVTGPWLCHTCGTNEEPVRFATYYEYRHHLQDVHMEKIDARICEHCGHRASKRNLLLYHLFTKHGVAPPRNCQFPKCDQCEYVALSESLLIKHRNNHSNTRDFICKVCNAAFKSNGALQGHMQTNLHSDPYKKIYECPFCQKQFMRNINLKAHIRVSHKELMKPYGGELDLDEIGDEVVGDEAEGQVMEVPVIDMMNQDASGMTILAEHRSSEAEGLSHCASGIATSLGLVDGSQTVILLDENQEFIIQTTEIGGNEYVTDGGELVQEVQEYIVPEMISEERATADGDQGLVEYTEEHPVHGTEEVLMILTDHCYAEEVVDKERHHGHVVVQNGGMEIADGNMTVEEQQEEMSSEVLASEAAEDADGEFVAEGAQQLDTTAETYPVEVKDAFAKSGVEMSDLLGEWDEELSQEAEDAEEGSAARQDCMPTRDDIPREMFSAPVVVGAETVADIAKSFQDDEGGEEFDEEYESKGELSAMQAGDAEAGETSLPADAEQQMSMLVDAEEMAHDSASLMAETGENNALVMDMEMDASFSQDADEDAGAYSEDLERHASFAVETETPFAAATAHGAQYTDEAQQVAAFATGSECESVPGGTVSNENLAAVIDTSTQQTTDTEQLTTFAEQIPQPPRFMPFSERPSYPPYSKTNQIISPNAQTDEPSTESVTESDPLTTLASATVEHSSMSIDVESGQETLIVREPEGSASSPQEPVQSLTNTGEGNGEGTPADTFQHETSGEFDQSHTSENV